MLHRSDKQQQQTNVMFTISPRTGDSAPLLLFCPCSQERPLGRDLCSFFFFFIRSDKLNRTYVFYRPGWPILTVVLRERRTSERSSQRPNASPTCAKTPKRGMTYCAPSARSQTSPPGSWSCANSTPSSCVARLSRSVFAN